MIGVKGLPAPGYLTLPRRRLSRTLRGMIRAPVPRDLPAGGEPDLTAPPRVLEEAREPPCPRGTARDTAMQAHRHHAGSRAALFPELIEGVAQGGGEVVGHLQAAPPDPKLVRPGGL